MRLRSSPSAPKRPERRKGFRWYYLFDALDVFDSIWLIVVVAAIVFLIFVGIPLLVFLVETLLIIPVGLVVGVVARVFFGRPWTIEATGAQMPTRKANWNVVGWRASERAVRFMEAAIRAMGDVASDPPFDVALPRVHRRVAR